MTTPRVTEILRRLDAVEPDPFIASPPPPPDIRNAPAADED
jgi:hypothetical protein